MTTRSHSKAKVSTTFFAVHESEIGPFRQLPQRSDSVAIGGIADMANLRVHGISCFDDGTDRFSGGYFSRPSSTSRGESCTGIVLASYPRKPTFHMAVSMSALGQQATSRWTFEKFWIIKLAATALGGIGGASVTRPWIGAISPGTLIFYRLCFYWWGRERGSGGDVRLSI